jgi:hypothetical protein
MPKCYKCDALTFWHIFLTRCSSFFCIKQSFGPEKPHFMNISVNAYKSIVYIKANAFHIIFLVKTAIFDVRKTIFRMVKAYISHAKRHPFA